MDTNGPERRIFLDYASTTPVDPKVREAMEPYLSAAFANPAAIYAEALEAKKAVEDARLAVARLLHARASEIVFAASGTESDNLAVLGALRRAKAAGVERPHVVTTAIEHPAVLEAARQAEREGCDATYVGVSEDGIVDASAIESAIKDSTVLISVMLANNEVGTIQPVSRIARAIREFKAARRDSGAQGKYPYFHVDASQAANYLPVWVDKLGCDLLTLDGSKIYGPKGVGALYVGKGVELEPLLYGGGQEKGLRPATENVPGIVGFAKALEIAQGMREAESARLAPLRDLIIDEALRRVPGASLNGSREDRLPNNANVCVPGLDGEFAVVKLDRKGVAAATASACRNLGDETYSYVLEAMGKRECSSSSLRFTLGRDTTESDARKAVQALLDIL